jgi:hypothetical protein
MLVSLRLQCEPPIPTAPSTRKVFFIAVIAAWATTSPAKGLFHSVGVLPISTNTVGVSKDGP